jgi:signal transduction histidine kinase
MSETSRERMPMAPGPLRGLSGKVLALTICFVMLGEVLIFLPSIADFRIMWLKSRISEAEIAALAVEAAPDRMLSDDLRNELLMGAGVRVVALKKGDARQLVLRSEDDRMVDAAFDLRSADWMTSLWDAFGAVLAGPGRVISVTDRPSKISGDYIEIALDEQPLRAAMFGYGVQVLALSVLLSLIVAGLLFVALTRVLVMPMRRLARAMVAFSARPDDPERIISASGRADEIGVAERELSHMQTELASMLQQRNHLAQLGLAVSKVSHDLRNMLSSALLISDRLAMIEDPTVQRFAPKLIASLERAIAFCAETLKFGRAQEPPPARARFPLQPLVEEVIDAAVVQASGRIVLYNNVAQSLIIDADRDQMFRLLTNLARNAIQALEGPRAEQSEGTITIKAVREGAAVAIDVRDNGPGIPDKVRDHLFEAYRSAARPGGTGLGLVIAAELARAHGGEVALAETGAQGTTFRITIPDRVSELRTGRRGERKTVEA